MIKRAQSYRVLAVGCGLAASVVLADSVGFKNQGDIYAEACAYGRGATAAAQAQAQATNELATFIQGAAIREFQRNSESLSGVDQTAQLNWLQSLQDGSQTGVAVQNLPVIAGKPYIQGTDTCIAVTLVHGQTMTSGNFDGLQWDDAVAEVAVVVEGEGWPSKTGQTARQVAELDGLKRAVSQVVGVWLQSNFTQYSNSEFAVNNDDVAESMRDVLAQQLHSRSDGFVKRWQLLDTAPLANEGLKVTLEAVVAQQEVAQASRNLLQAIGSPRVKVEAPEPLNSYIKVWLNDNGIEVSSMAAVTVNAFGEVRKYGDNARLHFNVQVNDMSGNTYGKWQNDPTLLALPNRANVLTDLMDVHLADSSQAQALGDTLRQAFLAMVARGGLVHEVAISSKYMTSSQELPGILRAIGGVRDVVVSGDSNTVMAQLRYNGTAADLASSLQQALTPLLREPLPQAEYVNEFKILFL